MNPIPKAILFALISTALVGCDRSDKNLGSVEYDWKDKRSHTAQWSQDGEPVLEVSVTYHGKQPALPFEGPEPSYDWRKRDTDFYSCTLRNLTNRVIRLDGVNSELESGTSSSRIFKGSSYLKERWGSDLIEPQGVLERRNTWVWGKDTTNTLTKTFKASILAVESNDGVSGESESEPSPTPLAFEVKLPYHR